MIAFIGSVFSPYYAWSRRHGNGDPMNFCAINVALYGGRGKRWSMTERGRQSMSRDRSSFTVGPSQCVWDGDKLIINVDEVAVPLPSRIRGTITLRPHALTTSPFFLHSNQRHQWQPIAPSADLEVAFDRPALNWRGRGYLDSNAGSEPLENGFKHWNWSRAHLNDETVIFYDVVERHQQPNGLALRFFADGRFETVAAPPGATLPKGLWRVSRATRADQGMAASVKATLEDAPFYLRSLIDTHVFGKHTVAIHESLSLDRFDKRWVQMLLPFRMPRKTF